MSPEQVDRALRIYAAVVDAAQYYSPVQTVAAHVAPGEFIEHLERELNRRGLAIGPATSPAPEPDVAQRRIGAAIQRFLALGERVVDDIGRKDEFRYPGEAVRRLNDLIT